MKTQALAGILVLFLTAACQREESGGASSPQAAEPAAAVATLGTDSGNVAMERQLSQEERRQFNDRMDAANAAYEKRDIAAARAELVEAERINGKNFDLLTLRGACHAEERDLKSALADFSAAVEMEPDNGDAHFNRGEMFFVTEQWDEAIKVFRLTKKHKTKESNSVLPLIDFKLMLCEAGRGDRDPFERLAAANEASPDPQLAAFTRVARALEAEDKIAAADALAAAKESVPDAADRAPWYDTMIEFGYQVPLEEY